MSKIIVTGAAGFIGSNLVDKLLEDGHDVIAIDNESAECHDKFYWNQNAKNYKLDICNYEEIFPLFEKVEYVFHLAAEARIQPSLIDPYKTINTNIIGTYNILQCSRLNKIKRVIYSSTSSAYGRKNNPPLSEDMKKDCLTPYSISKTCGEELCSMYSNIYGLETVILRYFNVYGDRQPLKGQYAPVIGLFMKQAKEGKKMTIVGDGSQRRDFTNIKDVVEANISALKSENPKIIGEIFNVGTGKNYSILEIANMIGTKYELIPPRLGEVAVTLADTSKIKEYMNWEAKISIEEWINENK